MRRRTLLALAALAPVFGPDGSEAPSAPSQPPDTLRTTMAQRAQIAERFGLGPTAEGSAAALGLVLEPAPELPARCPAIVHEGAVLHRPGDLHAALVAISAEALMRAGVDYMWRDAHALAAELAAGARPAA